MSIYFYLYLNPSNDNGKCTGGSVKIASNIYNGTTTTYYNFLSSSASYAYGDFTFTCSPNSGYIFDRAEVTKSNGNVTYTSSPVVVDADSMWNYVSRIDIYFEQNATYTITYNANGGSGAPSSQTFKTADRGSVTLSSTKPTRSGYTFKGWSTSSSATQKTYTAGTTVSLNASNYTLYAVWWPYFSWSTKDATDMNKLINYIKTYIGGSISTVSTGTLYLASHYNTIAPLVNKSKVSQGTIITLQHFQNLADGYNNY